MIRPEELVAAVNAVPVPDVLCEMCGDDCADELTACREPREDDYVRLALWRATVGFGLTYRDRWVMQQLLDAIDVRASRAQPAQFDLFTMAAA